MKISLDDLIFLETNPFTKQVFEEAKVICKELSINTSDVGKDKDAVVFYENTSLRKSKTLIRPRVTTDAYEVNFLFDGNLFVFIVEIDHNTCNIKDMYTLS